VVTPVARNSNNALLVPVVVGFHRVRIWQESGARHSILRLCVWQEYGFSCHEEVSTFNILYMEIL
jgi:hypothetical protein